MLLFVEYLKNCIESMHAEHLQKLLASIPSESDPTQVPQALL